MEINMTYNYYDNFVYSISRYLITAEVVEGENRNTIAERSKSYVDVLDAALSYAFNRLAHANRKDVIITVTDAEGFETPETVKQYLSDKYSIHNEIKEVTFKAR